MSNTDVLKQLMAEGRIRVASSPLELAPPAGGSWNPDRIQGMLLGLAIGDALGNTTESMTGPERHAYTGGVQHYLPNPWADGQRVGLPSDDTQMAAWTLEVLLDKKQLDVRALAGRFATETIFGIGSSVRAFRNAYRQNPGDMWAAAPLSAGNGALMRIAPVVLPHVTRPTHRLAADVVLAARLTHDDHASHACCLAFAFMLVQLLQMSRAPEPAWWLEEFVRVAAAIEGNGSRYQSRVTRGPAADYEGTLHSFVRQFVAQAFDQGLPVHRADAIWYSGAYLLETMPAVLYILMRHGHDPNEAIVRAVNDTWDNDSVGAIVGAAVGALHGASSLRPEWVRDLLGRTRANDDGHLFDLISQACQGPDWRLD